jgi:hypothetical protein
LGSKTGGFCSANEMSAGSNVSIRCLVANKP